MSSANVYTALNSYIQNNSIDLWAAANGSPDLAGMLPVLGLFNINAAYTLTFVVLTQSPSGASVRLTGSGSFNGANPYTANATLQYIQEGNVFSLELAITTDWIISNFFSSLPETLMQVPTIQQGILWYPSVLNGMTIRTAVFSGKTRETKLTLTGFLLQPNNPNLLNRTPMVGPWPLRLSGSVEMPTSTRSYPLINLDARGNDTIINVAKQQDINGPDAMGLSNPGLTLLVQPLKPQQPNRIAFSTIELFADFALGEIKGRIATLVLSNDDVWNFTVRFKKNVFTLRQGLAQLTRIFGVELPIPMNFPVLTDFYVGEIDMDLQNTGSNAIPSFSLLNLAVTIRSEKTWDPPIPFVTIDKVGTRWVWGWSMVNGEGGPEKRYTLTGSVFGTINFGGSNGQTALLPAPPPPDDTPDGSSKALAVNDNQVSLNVNMSLPNFIISGSLAQDSYIPIGKALNFFFKNEGPSTGLQKMKITRLRFSADPIGQNYFAEATIFFGEPGNPDPQQGWMINLFVITIILNQLEFNIAVNDGKVSGGISGTFFLDQGDPSDYKMPRIMISAEYPPQQPDAPEGWTLSGHLYPGTSISVTKLVYKFIYGGGTTHPPRWVPDILIDRLDVVFTTGSKTPTREVKASYTFGGTISVRWEPNIFNTPLKINASASIDLAKPATTDTPSGKLTGTFSVNKIQLTASLTFGVPEPTYLFKVQFDQLWLQATTSWRGEQNNRHQVVSLQLGGVTLGDILEYLVNLAAPTIGFKLDSPWDVLKKVDLSRFVLTIDPKENIVEFVFNANVDLVIAQLDSIGVRYSKKSGDGKVDLILTGSFLGQQYTNDKPLSWDVINDPPPAVPGKGPSLVNLRYLGLGQRVTFSGTTPSTVADSIKKLKQDMKKPPDDGNPLPSTMLYAANSQWLIGLDIQLMETLDLGIIFNDPKLYGLSIALSGERAGPLAGLRFEILYKKITDEIGMYRIEFQVPDMFRTIQLGAVSITLGIIVIEIYTNGNFKVDLGFPYNRNFDRSFSLQATIFIGRGGFYLGVLNGDTSTQVPRISNGNFSPVIELGIGISAGVGREIRAGILAGGAFVELQVIFQGVLAWFNPNSSGAAPAKFFKCQGVAAIHGKIYGSVDFVVVKVSITLEAYAQVSIIYECYQPMLIELEVDVSAEASIKILFVRIYFSFGVHLSLDFTVGSAEPTPWILSNNNSGGRSSAALATTSHHLLNPRRPVALRTNKHRRLQVLREAHVMTMGLQGTAALQEYNLVWHPTNKVFPDSPRNAHLTLLPVFTIDGVPVNWDGTTPVNGNPNYRSAFVLFADTGMSTSAVTAADCAIRSAAHSAMTVSDTDTSLLAADILTQGLLLYAIQAFPRDPAEGNNITAWQITSLLDQLNMPDTMSGGLSIDNLKTFFTTNINLWISGDITPRPDDKSAMVLPLPPFVGWTSPQGGTIDFSTKNKIGPWYEWGISQLLGSYFPVGGDNSKKPAQDDPSTYESFTSFMFRDFCLILMQNGIKEMQKQMNNTTVTVTTVSSVVQNLEQVAKTLPNASVPYRICSGDTVESVAESLGATVEELTFLNDHLQSDLETLPVGTPLTIKLGVPPEVLAMDNADISFAVTQCTLGTLVHQAAQNDTLQNIASLFNVASVATLLAYQDKAYPVLSSGPNILAPGNSFDLPQQTFVNAPADFVQLRVAGVFFARYLDASILKNTPLPDMANWYVQAIAEVNQDLLKQLFPEQKIPSVIELPPGQVLSVPNAYQNAYNILANRNNYTTVAGDTLYRIGLALVFQQDFGTTTPPGITQWPTFRAGVTSTGTQSWSIPAWQGMIIESGTNIESLVRRLIVNASWISIIPVQPSKGTWSYDWDKVAVWLSTAKIIAPLASITVPNATVVSTTPLSFSILSTKYGLTVTDAATRLKKLNGLYASGTVLKVKLLPAQDITVLVNAVLQGDSFTSIVNQSSRMLLSGLRLPSLTTDGGGHTVPDPAHPSPLYDLTGQQFNIALDSTKPTDNALTLSLASQQSWIKLFNSITVQTGQTLASLEAAYPNLLVYNPGLNESTFKVGMILLTAPVNSLDYSYTNADILGVMPATGLAITPVPATPPAPVVMKILGTVPRTYGLEHGIELQTPLALAIPTDPALPNITGNPGLWMLPSDLQEKARNGVTTLYEILTVQQGTAAGSKAVQINSSTYGTLIPFKVKRMNDSSSQFNLMGVDTDKRNLLITLSNWLRQQGSTDKTTVNLLLAPAPNATNTSGLTILSTTAANAFLIKTNLSTVSVPPAMLTRAANLKDTGNSVYYATLASLADFLELLWEGSVVGGIGYYFSPGMQLPGSAFDQQGNITLQLLVIAGTQQSLAPNGRSLLPFNNCALIGPGAYNAQFSLFMESAGSTDPSETIAQALVPPGNVGFELVTANPDTITPAPPVPVKLLRNLYSLLSFEVAQQTGSPFYAPPSGMPVMPDPSDNSRQQAWEKARALRKAIAAKLVTTADTSAKPYWRYAQVLPVSRFIRPGTTLAGADVTGLPPFNEDPYQGFGTQTALPVANFVFGFGDVLGNRTGANGTGQGTTPVKVGYTDNIVSVGDWSSVARYFNVQQSGSNAVLTIYIAPRPSELLPTPAQPGDVNNDLLKQQQKLFSQTYYQLIQPGLTAWLVTSLNYISDPNYGNKGVAISDSSPLWKFAAGSYAITTSLRSFLPAKPTGITTLGDIITKYGVEKRYAELAQANAGYAVQQLFGTTVPVVPAYFPFVEHLSITALAALPPAGWPVPPVATTLLTYTENTSLLLKAGTLLVIPGKTITTGTTPPTACLQDLADGAHTTVIHLAVQNSEQPVLQTGFEFTVDVDEHTEVVVTVDAATNSLKLVVDAFANNGVNTTVEALATTHNKKTGMLALDKTLDVKAYLVKDGNTLADNQSGVSVTDLANNNGNTPDLFDTGALIYFGNFANVITGTAPVSLQQFADRYACPVALLLSNNSGLTLPSNSAFVLPGTLAWPTDTGSIKIPYTVRNTDTLNNIAQQFDFNTATVSAALQLATNNTNMPGTLIPNIDVTITVGTNTYPVNTGSGNPSFTSFLKALQQKAPAGTLQDIVNSMGGSTGVLNPGALFLCPPAKFQQDTMPVNIPDMYGVSAAAFALANTAIQGIIAPQKTLQASVELGSITIQTGDDDTFNTLIVRFAAKGISLSASEIVDINANVAFIKSCALAMLPPAVISFSTSLDQNGPYESPIVPLKVSLRLLRPKALIYPGFETTKGTGAVEMAESDFPAPVKDNNKTSGLTLNDFVANMKTALPQLRLGTAQVTGVVQDLWQVNFTSSGFKKVELIGAIIINNEQKPRYFALKPLYQQLVTRPVTVSPLKIDGTLDAGQQRSFQSIDVELWARRFVEDMDRFLSGPYAAAIYNNTNIRNQLKLVLDAKTGLIPAIAAGLSNVLNVQDANKVPALASAVDALEQQLGVSLAKTYESTVLIQYDSKTEAAVLPKPAGLYGNGKIIDTTTNEPLFGLSMIAAKTDLSKASSYVNFLMTLDNPAFHKDVLGYFFYDISHLEFNISSDHLPQNFKASDWLSFIPLLSKPEKPAALSGTDPAIKIDVPIPLRNFPDMPKIVSQQAKQTFPDGTETVNQLGVWNYDYVYTHQHAEQDYVVLKAEFNLKLPAAVRKMTDPLRDLFTELAQYITVADPLWQLINGLTDPKTKLPIGYIENAVRTFATLAGNINQYWSARISQKEIATNKLDLVVAALSYEFNARVSYRNNHDLDTLTLKRLGSQPGPNNSWPDAFAQSPDGTFTQLDMQSNAPDTAIYKVPAGMSIPPVTWPVFKLTWGSLNLATVQNARSQMHVQRNQDLIDYASTNTDFIFSTDTIIAPGIVTPLNTFGKRVDISALGSNLTDALNACFNGLFGPAMNGQPVTIQLSYGFELVAPSGPDDEGLITYLPIGLYPNQTLSATTANDLNNVIVEWKRDNNPAEKGGAWVFSLKQYSQLTDYPQTLLNIEHLVYRIPPKQG
ncbi:LysM domain-containing protein [Hydrobacter penzbergensis]|uniref:LysM domain-containing protein n=1 Tax=Hydrobacter penzbergensis TaxID=1235997 RepID=A0A8X8IHI6_9BACT|nr:LysM peptidoglycan-binding domain-containing protein [Hydrobacter penzbergensis]SDX40941.1 LysM domain-containing protein [Hydrobacter penzbergensis]